MNKIFNKLALRNIKSNFKQFISVILIVFLCTMLLCGFIVNSYTLDGAINSYFSENKLADLWLYVDKVTEKDTTFLDENNIEHDERFFFETSASVDQVTGSNNAKIFVYNGELISKPELSFANVDNNNNPIGCYIDKHVADNYKLSARGGEYFHFDCSVPVETLSSNSLIVSFLRSVFGSNITLEFSFEIVGTMQLNECADTYSSWPVFITETTFLNEANRSIYNFFDNKIKENPTYESFRSQISNLKLTSVPYNQILIRTDDVDALTETLKNYYAQDGVDSKLVYILNRSSVESVVLLNSEISQSKKMIYVFPVIFLIISILVIVTTIDQLVLGEKQKIGTLKSIGIPDRRILRHYSGYGAVLCAIGSVLGIVLGTLIIPEIMFVKYNLVYSMPSKFVSLKVPYLILISVLVGMTLLGYLVSLLVCHGILHKKPVECLRQDINIEVKGLGKRKKKLKRTPLGLRMAFRNVRIKPVRTLMATIGIMGCVALLLCGFGIGDTIDNSVKNDLGGLFNYDITTTYTTSDFLENLQDISEVDYENSEPYLRYFVEAKDKDNQNVKGTYLYQIAENSKLCQIQLSGDEVMISKSVADALRVGVGDKVTVEAGGILHELTISKVMQTSFLNGIYVSSDMETVAGFNPAVATKGIWIKCDSNVEAVVSKINAINGTDGAKSMQDMVEYVESRASSIDIMTGTLKTFAILLAVIVLLNLIFLIMKERVREIATLKVLGQGMLTISSAVLYEILIMALCGTVLGMFLGYPLLLLVLSINRVEILNFIYHISPLSYVLTVIIVLATIFIVNLLSLVRIKKIDMIESLKSVE